MSPTTIQLLRLLHILGGAFWFGSILFIAVFLLPSLRAVGPGAGPVMEQLTVVRKLPIYMMALPLITILSGMGLYWNASGGFNPQWMHSGPGMTFGTGATLAILAAVIGGAVNAPAGKRMGELGTLIRARGGPPTPQEAEEMHRLQDRLYNATKVVAVIVTLAVAAMSVARYMPT